MAIRIGASSPGGTFHTQAIALADIAAQNGLSEPFEIATNLRASVENAEMLHTDRLDFGFMASNWIGRALRGEAPFPEAIDLRMAAPANAGPMFFVTRADSDIRTVADFAGKRIAMGEAGSGMVQHCHTIFGVLGLDFDAFTPVHLDFPEGAEALKAGDVDVQWQCPIPNEVMTDLADTTDIRVLPYADGQMEKLLAEVPFYRPSVVSAGALRGVAEDVPQIAVVNVLVTHARVADDLVTSIVGTMIRNADALAEANPLYRGLSDLFEPVRTEGQSALAFDGVPLHPGAVLALKDAGYLDR